VAKQGSKARLLNDIYTERRRLEKNLSMLTAEDMLQPGVTGTWSVKDIVAHLSAWEKLLMEWYHTGLLEVSSTTLPVGMSRSAIDALNQQIYESNRFQTLDDTITEFHASYGKIVAMVEGIPEEDMFARKRFKWTGKLTLVDYITGNTCNHYAWANSQIRKWMKLKASENNK
jgi:hypothetical protein